MEKVKIKNHLVKYIMTRGRDNKSPNQQRPMEVTKKPTTANTVKSHKF